MEGVNKIIITLELECQNIKLVLCVWTKKGRQSREQKLILENVSRRDRELQK